MGGSRQFLRENTAFCVHPRPQGSFQSERNDRKDFLPFCPAPVRHCETQCPFLDSNGAPAPLTLINWRSLRTWWSAALATESPILPRRFFPEFSGGSTSIQVFLRYRCDVPVELGDGGSRFNDPPPT